VGESLTALAPEIRVERFAADADITDKTGRVADNHCLLWNVVQNDRARSYHCVASDGNSGNDGCICSNGGAFPHQGGDQLFVFLFDPGPWPSIVGKNRVWADEDTILDRDFIPQGNAVLDGHGIADLYLRFDKGMIADIALAANNRAIHHMGEGPNAGTPADRCRLNERLRMDKDVCNAMQVFDPYSVIISRSPAERQELS
jgi:hypothetical protein